jgi:hypothetical protein
MRFKIIFIVAAIALVLAGCGGGGSSSSKRTSTSESTTAKSEGGNGQQATATKTPATKEASDKPLNQSEFVIQMNEICIQVPPGYKEHLKEAEKGGKKLTKAEINLKAAVPPLYSAIEEMETVVPPKSEEGTLQKMIDSLEAAAKGLEAKPTSPLSGPKSPYAEFQAVSTKHGFASCTGL